MKLIVFFRFLFFFCCVEVVIFMTRLVVADRGDDLVKYINKLKFNRFWLLLEILTRKPDSFVFAISSPVSQSVSQQFLFDYMNFLTNEP